MFNRHTPENMGTYCLHPTETLLLECKVHLEWSGWMQLKGPGSTCSPESTCTSNLAGEPMTWYLNELFDFESCIFRDVAVGFLFSQAGIINPISANMVAHLGHMRMQHILAEHHSNMCSFDQTRNGMAPKLYPRSPQILEARAQLRDLAGLWLFVLCSSTRFGLALKRHQPLHAKHDDQCLKYHPVLVIRFT